MNKNGKTNWIGVAIIFLLVVSMSGIGMVVWKSGMLVANTGVDNLQETIGQVSNTGKSAVLAVKVRDISNNNVNTRLAVATYCVDQNGNFVIDGTTSSTTADLSGRTTFGSEITCYAFSSTIQTFKPVTIVVDEEVEPITIDAYTIGTSATVQLYNDQYVTGTAGAVNVTVGASQTGTMQKLRVTNTDADSMINLGGVYFNTVTSSNLSDIKMAGGATLFGMDHASSKFVKSDLATNVGARKDLWDYVFELDDDSTATGNQPLMLEENDYVESGTVEFVGDADGCTTTAELVSTYAFTKGYFRSSKDKAVKFGAETDADSSAVVSSDYTGYTLYCT